MKKIELTKLIERKKILKESLDIIKEYRDNMDEVGGYDDPELMSQYHGNYFDELAKTFFHFDSLTDELISGMSKVMDDEEVQQTKVIVQKFVDFMDEYNDYLLKLKNKLIHLSGKTTRTNLPGMGNIGVNENK